MTEQFIAILKNRGLLQPGARFLAAVSGGIDSVVLCELCFRAGIRFSIGHCNFGLRGKESERDEIFVKDLGTKYNAPVFVEKFETEKFAREKKISIQEAARDLRYEWFNRLAQTQSFAAVLLAHHANDNIETLLMNFFRGTGLDGLTGMNEFTPGGKCFRPLLSFSRSAIEDFARVHHLEWVEDSSNASSKYTRNFFRNELIPLIKNIFPEVESNLLDNMSRFRQVREFYHEAVNKIRQDIFVYHAGEVRIPVNKLKQYNSPALMFEIFREFGFGEKQNGELEKLLHAGSGKFIENDTFQVIRHRNWLVITRRNQESEVIAIPENVKQVDFALGRLQLDFVHRERFSLEKSELVAQVDAREIEFPLLLRKWKPGDYFYPLGMRKKKKVARFFIDRKLSKNQKENAWVIESNKRIFWIVGMRIDDRFKVLPSTNHFVQLTISSP